MRKKRVVKIIVIILVALIIIAGIYFGVREYANFRVNRNTEIFQQGFNYGYVEAVLQIINISDSCESFPVYAGDETRNLISLDCI